MSGEPLEAFITARLDEIAAAARALRGPEWVIWENGGESTDFTVLPAQTSGTMVESVADVWREDCAGWIARHDPAHVLRDVGAKRAILSAWQVERGSGFGGSGFTEGLEFALRQLAAIWNDHPDWRPEWRPQ